MILSRIGKNLLFYTYRLDTALMREALKNEMQYLGLCQ